MADSYALSTRQTARLLGVHESSIKRWCNGGELECELTAGGHRRIPVGSLVSFADQQGLSSTLTDCGDNAPKAWHGLNEALRHNDFTILLDTLKDDLDRNDPMSSLRVLSFIQSEGISLPTILDQLVGRLMTQIGESWIAGETDVGEEHRLTQLMMDLMHHLRWLSPPGHFEQTDSRLTAVVGCLPGGRHELGSLMVRLVLEQLGWRVIYLGADTPIVEFEKQQILHKARAVAVSVVPPQGLPHARDLVVQLDASYRPEVPFHLALGGAGLESIETGEFNSTAFESLDVFATMTAFADWVNQIGSERPVN